MGTLFGKLDREEIYWAWRRYWTYRPSAILMATCVCGALAVASVIALPLFAAGLAGAGETNLRGFDIIPYWVACIGALWVLISSLANLRGTTKPPIF